MKTIVPQYLKNIFHLLNAWVAVIFNGYPSRGMKVIGVTGTDGKTTTTSLIYHILKKSGYPVAAITTVGAYVGDKKIDTGFHVTTPDSWKLQSLISRFKKKAIKYLILEVTSHALDQNRVAGINFDVGVLTNITHDHLDYHKTFQKYRKSKAKLFQNVNLAVINRDDPSYGYISKRIEAGTRITSYGVKNEADYCAKNIHYSSSGSTFKIKYKGKRYTASSRLFGEYNVSNILAAVSVCRELNIDLNYISQILLSFNAPEGRLEKITNKRNINIYVDFAHTPNALERLLSLLKQTTKGRLIAVLGSAGKRDISKRRIMGEISVRYADISIFTAEDPRHERVEDIIEEMAEGARQVGAGKKSFRNYFLTIPDRGEAIYEAVMKIAHKGDVVVVCGKGHEKSMNYGGVEYPWSDKKALKESLRGKVVHIFE